MEPLPLFTRNSSQELRLDLMGKSSTPPPLLEPPKISNFQDSSYSQRLRVLAGATSPNATTPRKQLLQPNPVSPMSAESSPSPPDRVQSTTHNNNNNNNNNSLVVHNNNNSSASSTTSEGGKGLMCEYCCKSFQFKSNLVVHRRSHTGEKPFKCHVCEHACTQASKLKRHMKTHRRPTENGRKGRPTENGACGSEEDHEEEDEEEEEEEEEVNVDGLEEDEDSGGKLVIAADEDMVAEDLTKKPAPPMSNGEPRPAVKRSVISEIMEKIGCIPPYDEAYKQALKESSCRGAGSDDGMHSPCERPPREGTRSAGQSPLGFGLLDFQDAKRSRLADDKDGGHYLYAGVWIPRVEQPYRGDLYGLEGSTKSESALGGRPGPSTAAKPKESQGPRRNDTCEYCGKVFKNCSNLTVHRRSHTGEKPYKCELCSYACAQSSKLTRHMKTHGRLGKDVYRCRFCDMPFSVASTLEKHMRKCVVSQSGGSPYLVSEDSKEMTA